jgi:hypothetical protein
MSCKFWMRQIYGISCRLAGRGASMQAFPRGAWEREKPRLVVGALATW